MVEGLNPSLSDRRVNENIERKEPDEIGKITTEQAIRVAENVIKGDKLVKEYRKLQKEKDDEPTIQ